jgi:fatty acid desaturase
LGTAAEVLGRHSTQAGRFGLSPQILRGLSKPSLALSLWGLACLWIPMALAVLISQTYPSIWLYALCVLVIASRQHGCMILMHEGTHYRLAASRSINEFLSDGFAALPIFMSTEVYRRNHLRHHSYLCTDKDPDWVRKYGNPEWNFPKTLPQTAQTWSLYLRGRGIIEMLRMWQHLLGLTRSQLADPSLRSRHVFIATYYAAAALCLTLTGGWTSFLWYWVVPSLTVLPLIMRLRSIAEHFALEYKGELTSSRNVECGWLESFFIAPFHVNLHLNHHLYPSVPFHKLRALNQELKKDPGFVQNAHVNSSYLGLLGKSLMRDLVSHSIEPLAADMLKAPRCEQSST